MRRLEELATVQMRLAWFTPLAPVRSGIASYSAMVLPALAARHELAIFVGDDVWAARRSEAHLGADGFAAIAAPWGPIRPVHDFAPLHLAQPFDLVVYQLGNAGCHDHMWAYLTRYPGLVVLHDAQLHQSRAHALIARGRTADLRAELAFGHPDAPPGVAEWILAGLGNPGAPIWPLTAVPLAAARAVAVHFPALAADLRDAWPGLDVHVIRHGSPDLGASGINDQGPTTNFQGTPNDQRPTRPAEREPSQTWKLGVRDSLEVGSWNLGVPAGGVVFAAFGLVTPEKRVPQMLRALAAIRDKVPNVRLRLVGGVTPHYDVAADARAHGVDDLVEVTGWVDDDAFDRAILDSDVCLCLRWPTNREASGPWLRALAAGKPTVVNDLAHLVDLPTLDPRTWNVQVASPAAADATRAWRRDEAIAVAIDILDEDHSLVIAMRRLALDAGLRADLGAAARRYWAAGHTVEHMAADYERAIAAAAAAPVRPSRPLPAHVTSDGTALARRLAADVGVAVDFLAERP
ncbi:MAG: glycosyltransferase family 4 protein [Vicinamibacteraceae bacterium]